MEEPRRTAVRRPSAAGDRARSVVCAATATLASVAALITLGVPALMTTTGASLTVWNARGLAGITSVLWILQIAVAALGVGGAVGALGARRTRFPSLMLGVASALSVVVAGRLWTYPRDIGTPPLEPAIGLGVLAVQIAALVVALLVLARRAAAHTDHAPW